VGGESEDFGDSLPPSFHMARTTFKVPDLQLVKPGLVEQEDEWFEQV